MGADDKATITTENWTELSKTPKELRYSEKDLQVGASILSIIELIGNDILPNYRVNEKNVIFLYYRPDTNQFGSQPELNAYFKNSQNSKDSSDMPTKLIELIFNTKDDHYTSFYYAKLPSKMHLNASPGYCYPFYLRQLLLDPRLCNSGQDSSNDDLDLEREDEKRAQKGQHSIMNNNCQSY